jgi:hypothetical protein
MLIVGRQYRKGMSRTVAFVLFRWVALWLMVAACAGLGQAGQAAALVIVATDIVIESVFLGQWAYRTDEARERWVDTLTHRIFYRLLFDLVRDHGTQDIDIDYLFSKATEEAGADLRSVDKREDFWADTTLWHWFGGAWSFLYQFLSYGLYYGSAFYLGSIV